MTTSRRLTCLLPLSVVALLVLGLGVAAAGQASGRIEGRVVHADGGGVKGVGVVLNETSATALTGSEGGFAFAGLAPGTYTITLALGTNTRTVSNVKVAAGATTRVEETVDWKVGFTQDLVVLATSRRLERIVEAPAAVTSVSQAEIEAKAAAGQLPALLEYTPGVAATQSGLFDYNLNTRGFNSSLNRRVATRIDGRDPSISFLGAQEWSALSFGLDDVSSLEFVRGPSAALYGANASSGVLDLTTREPRSSQGGFVRVAAGELNTVNLDARWAGALGGDWFVKAVGGMRDSGDFTASRLGAAEYAVPCPAGVSGDCLPQERVAIPRLNDNQIFFGGLRLDKYMARGIVLTMEGGLADVSGPVLQTGIGRVQVVDSRSPWARFRFGSDHLSAMVSYTGRQSSDQVALASGANIPLSSSRIDVEGQGHWRFAGERVRVVAGASAGVDDIDSFDKAQGRQTLLFAPVNANRQAVFGQGDWNLTPRLKVVLAGRGDWGSLHDFQFSPKAAVVYTVTSGHSLRLTYNEAFQAPNYSEVFLQTDAAAPANLSGLNAVCAGAGVNCGFGLTRVLAVGNEDLTVEKVRAWEAGYKGLLGERAFLTVDYYRSRASGFITDLLPQLGTALGRINTNFGPWQGPAGLPESAAALIRSLAPAILSNNIDGSTVLVAASYSNFGTVNTQGTDIGLSYFFAPGWQASLTHSWFDFEIANNLPGFSTLLLPNAPGHTVSAGVVYDRDAVAVRVNARWVDDFRWGVGPFQGPVESYATVNLSARYRFNERVTVGLDVSNLFNDKHWESFGGDLLRRRALVDLRYGW